jgi:methylated-DNA-[protein]-cysteine S-methyltransferase
VYASTLATPIGRLLIQGDETNIYAIDFSDDELVDTPSSSLTEQAKQQLQDYFCLKRHHFTFPICQSGTEFQQAVWKQLAEIAVGVPISYAALSRRMNNPLAIRAIAAANGKNKLAIVIPCHRVIGSSGDLVGYAGGLWRKRWLLEHEIKLSGIGQSTLAL